MLSKKSELAPSAEAKAASKSASSGLRIGEPNDAFEQEADRIADDLMVGGTAKPAWSLSKMGIGAPLQRKWACGGSGGSEGECEECKKNETTLQRRAASDSFPATVPPIVDEVLRTPGQPLDPATRAFMEPKFGHDFSQVRVHSDGRAEESARAVNALAYTVGSNVVFGAGHYNLASAETQRLLAHELAHTVQQSRGGQPPRDPHSSLERDADRAAAQIGHGLSRIAVMGASAPGLARAGDGTTGGTQASARALRHDGLTPEETSALGAKRAQFAIPEGRSTLVGILIDNDTGKRFDVKSGEFGGPSGGTQRGGIPRGPGEGFSGGAPTEKNIVTHIEGHAAAIMREQGITNGTLLSPEAPCRVCSHPAQAPAVSKVLPPGSRLTVVYPDSAETYWSSALPQRAPQPGAVSGPAGKSLGPRAASATPQAPSAPPSPEGATEATRGTAPGIAGTAPEPGGGVGPSEGVGPGEGGIRPGLRTVPKGAGSVPLQAAKMFGPMLLDMINRYYMAKEEAQRAIARINATIAGLPIQSRTRQEVEKHRLDIARRQHRGVSVYVTVSLHLFFTNDVFDKLELSRVTVTEVDQSNIMVSVISHEPVFGTEGKIWYVDVSVPVPPVEVSGSEEIGFRLEELEEQAAGPSGMSPDIVAKRNRLLAEQQKIKAEEERAKKAEISRPVVIADPKKRAEQQREIADQLRQLEQKKGTAPQKKEETRQPSPGPALLMPAPQPQPPALLPGAPGEGLIQQAARVVEAAKAEAHQLEQRGTALEGRVGTDRSPSHEERQAFLDDEQRWRLRVKYLMNWFRENSREEAVNGLGELLDRIGPRLAEICIHLGGD